MFIFCAFSFCSSHEHVTATVAGGLRRVELRPGVGHPQGGPGRQDGRGFQLPANVGPAPRWLRHQGALGPTGEGAECGPGRGDDPTRHAEAQVVEGRQALPAQVQVNKAKKKKKGKKFDVPSCFLLFFQITSPQAPSKSDVPRRLQLPNSSQFEILLP